MKAENCAASPELYRQYFQPVYTFVRWRHNREDAEDLTQDFFACLLKPDALASASQDKGRLRCWLLGALKHYLANSARSAKALKRGGGATTDSFDLQGAEQRYAMEAASWGTITPEHAYARRWALSVIEHVIDLLGHSYEPEEFGQLKGLLLGPEPPSYDDIARKLGVKTGALRVRVCRMREHWRKLLREEIQQTVSNADVEDEIRSLISTLA